MPSLKQSVALLRGLTGVAFLHSSMHCYIRYIPPDPTAKLNIPIRPHRKAKDMIHFLSVHHAHYTKEFAKSFVERFLERLREPEYRVLTRIGACRSLVRAVP